MKNLVLILCIAFSISISAQIDGVGINTIDPKSTLDINGNLSLKVVSLNGGPSGTPTEIDDGTYINLEPTVGNAHFELPDPTLVPGRIYILRNISNTQTALILTKGVGVLFFSGDSSTGSVLVNMTTSTGSGNETKTLIFVSDRFNWTYGKLGF
jgi:hypothetical protein